MTEKEDKKLAEKRFEASFENLSGLDKVRAVAKKLVEDYEKEKKERGK